VSITSTTSGASIYYTTDGSTPTTSSAKYTAPVNISATTTLNAMAAATGFTNSPMTSGVYTIQSGGTAASPTFSPPAGTYSSAQSVTITSTTSGATIYYTTDGSTPTTSSTKYTAPVSISTTTTLNAMATATGFTNSPVTSGIYTIQPTAARPSFSPAPGTYTNPINVSIFSTTAGATMYYTTDGTTPTTASSKYTGPFTVSTTTTVKAIATAPNFANSAVSNAPYKFAAATPSLSPPPGTYTGTQMVTITTTTAGATIYYTTDGTTPTTSSNVYTGPVAVSVTETLNAIATAPNYVNSAVAGGLYTIN
jgi:hypothetical protein